MRIDAGELEAGSLGGLAERLGITDRHLRRVFAEQFGVTPVVYAQTQRLLMAKRLLTETTLPLTEIAYAAGFGSVRRFNALYAGHYGMSPSVTRGRTARPASCSEEGLRFQLAYRPPFDWPRLLAFLAGRCVPGVESVEGAVYHRSLRLDATGAALRGWLAVAWTPERHAVSVVVSHGLLRGLPAVLAGVRRLCDLSCDPAAVSAVLGPLADDAPGLRVPGSMDGFEMAIRAILGQQVTVRAAHTLAGRLVERFGEPLATPIAGVTHLFPPAGQLVAQSVEALAELGIVRQRASAILALARAVTEGRLDLGPAADVPAALAALESLPGIGRWTANYIALRALAWPDAWPTGDIALQKALGAPSAKAAEARAEIWRPWRGYATLHLWRRLGEANLPDIQETS